VIPFNPPVSGSFLQIASGRQTNCASFSPFLPPIQNLPSAFQLVHHFLFTALDSARTFISFFPPPPRSFIEGPFFRFQTVHSTTVLPRFPFRLDPPPFRLIISFLLERFPTDALGHGSSYCISSILSVLSFLAKVVLSGGEGLYNRTLPGVRSFSLSLMHLAGLLSVFGSLLFTFFYSTLQKYPPKK